MIKGIDVSHWQGDIDFNKVKASGIDFVIIRAGYGVGHVDEFFKENYRKAKEAGLNIGAYWYSYASSVSEAVLEAKSLKDVIKGYKFNYPIYFDLEEKSQLSKGSAFCNALIKAFLDEMEKDRYFSGFYTSLSVLNNLISDNTKNRYSIWVAQWSKKCSYNGTYGIWQYSSDGSVNGIKGRVDMNYSYIDYPTVISNGKFNGYSDNINIENESIDDIAGEVIKGLWGNGNDRKSRLENAGYNYEEVQEKVNELLVGGNRKSIDEIAREVIKGLWGNGNDRKTRLISAGYNYEEIQKKVNELL